MTFSENLKLIMRTKKITANTIAERMGVTRGTVTHWSNAERFPKDDLTIKRLADVLGVKVGDLFDENKMGQTFRPLIGSASCGVPTTYYYEDVEMIPVSENVGLSSYFIRADGESMATRINNGDLLLCDPDAMIRSGDIVHFEWDGEHGVKKYVEQNGMRMMVAFNQDYPPIIITDEYELRMVRVILRQERM
jgi:repressor LexA